MTDLDNWGHAVCGRLLPEHREDGKEEKEKAREKAREKEKEKAEEAEEEEKPAEPTERHPGGDTPPVG